MPIKQAASKARSDEISWKSAEWFSSFMRTDRWSELRPDTKAHEEGKDTSQKFLNTFKPQLDLYVVPFLQFRQMLHFLCTVLNANAYCSVVMHVRSCTLEVKEGRNRDGSCYEWEQKMLAINSSTRCLGI